MTVGRFVTAANEVTVGGFWTNHAKGELRYLFNMRPAYMFSEGVGTLRIDGYLTLILLTHGELTMFHWLMNYGQPLSVRKAHSSM